MGKASFFISGVITSHCVVRFLGTRWGNLSDIPTAELHWYAACVYIGWLGLNPVAELWLWKGKAGLRHSVWLILAPSWPKYLCTWMCLNRNPVYLMVGGWVNRKCDMTLGRPVYSCKAWATPPKEASFASELSSREASTRMAVTTIARLKFSVAVDVLDWQILLTWLRSPPPSLQCLLHCTT